MPNSLEFLKSTGHLPLSLSELNIGGAKIPECVGLPTSGFCLLYMIGHPMSPNGGDNVKII